MIHPQIALPQGAEWLVILAIVVFVFGAAKLPDLARGTGRALRIFKAETKGLADDDQEGWHSHPGAAKDHAQVELESGHRDVAHTSELEADAEPLRRGNTP